MSAVSGVAEVVLGLLREHTDLCDRCAEPMNKGLCHRCGERDRSLLPQAAIPPWIKLMGMARVEQRRLQLVKVRPSAAAVRAMRRRERAERRAELRRELLTLMAVERG